MNFEVKAIHGEPREWSSSRGGAFLSYKVDLEDADGSLERAVEWNKKSTSRAPEVGELVAGILEDTNFGTKLKVDYEASRALPQNGIQMQSRKSSPHEVSSGSSKQGWTPESERDPERSARILRQHSQGIAVQILAAQLSDQQIHEINLPDLFDLCDELDTDVIQAGQRASEGQRKEDTPPETPNEGSSSPSSPLELPVSHQELCEALDTAGLVVGPARDVVAGFMAAELSPERMKKAFSNLVGQDLEMQAKTLSALKSGAETWSGKPLPQGDALDNDDNVPF